jgi:hypothetical protein
LRRSEWYERKTDIANKYLYAEDGQNAFSVEASLRAVSLAGTNALVELSQIEWPITASQCRGESLLKLRVFWTSIRWKILIISSLFSVGSVTMVTCFSIAVLNVVIRRESAYQIEARIKIMVDSHMGLINPILDRVQGCQYASDSALSAAFTEHLNTTWPGQSIVTIDSQGVPRNAPGRLVCFMQM